MELAPECNILKEHTLLTFTQGRYSYRIDRRGPESIYKVTDGRQTITVPIGWAFGLGSAGQTYVFQKDGEFYESRVSFYKELNGLDLTMGAAIRPQQICWRLPATSWVVTRRPAASVVMPQMPRRVRL